MCTVHDGETGAGWTVAITEESNQGLTKDAGSCALNPCADSSCNAIAALRRRTNRCAPNGPASCQLAEEVLVSRQGLRHHRRGFAGFPHLQPLCGDPYV